MIRHLLYLSAAAIAAIAIGSSVAKAQLVSTDVAVPPVPPEIRVPAGNVAFLKGHAIGTQNYICRTSATGFSWTLFGPQATLFFKFKLLNIEVQQQITTHFLSPNPDENGLPRPAWQSSFDTSAVWGKAAASSTDPNYVAPGAIPWLRVEVVGAERGPGSGATLVPTTFIHRLNTTGGVAPAAGCSQVTDAGSTAIVPYTADYFFYKASR